MRYDSRIPADPDYLSLLGRAFYNFTYLEWVVVWTIAKLSPDGFGSVPRGRPSGDIAKALEGAIQATDPPLPSDLRRDLLAFHKAFRAAITARNKLIHAHPFTAEGGAQLLAAGAVRWSEDEVVSSAREFEEAAIRGNELFHGPLKKARPGSAQHAD